MTQSGLRVVRTAQPAAAAAAALPPVGGLPSVVNQMAAAQGGGDWSQFDRPAARRAPVKAAVGDGLRSDGNWDEEALDIPAFLRRQAD